MAVRALRILHAMRFTAFWASELPIFIFLGMVFSNRLFLFMISLRFSKISECQNQTNESDNPKNDESNDFVSQRRIDYS